jgi:hypothetical protein
MEIKQITPTTFVLREKYQRNREWNYSMFWASDVHFDSKYCRRDLLQRDFDEALSRNAPIILGGDFLDLMQGRDDKRGSKGALQAELKEDGYVNRVIETTVKWLEPYKDNIILILRGNHDLSFRRKLEIDMVTLLADYLNAGADRIKTGGYSNYIKLHFLYADRAMKSKMIFHSHSSGFAGKRSRGSLAPDILAGTYPDADIYITEHSHDAFIIPKASERCTDQGRIYWENKWFAQIPSYQASWENPKKDDFWNVKNMNPRPLGGYFLNFIYNRKEDDIKCKIEMTAT